MKPQSNKLRSKSYVKTTYVQMEKYKPRDWGYQSPKHQIIPHFIIGHYKRRIPTPKQEEFPVFKDLTKSKTSKNFFKRELKPAVFRSYILSQIATLPGAVKVEENKMNDDQNKKDRIRVVKNKNICFKNKMNNIYGSKVPFLLGSKEEKKEEEKINVTLKKVKSTGNLKVVVDNSKKLKVNKIKSPDRNRIKRNKKIK
jgi:hypothetical protein